MFLTHLDIYHTLALGLLFPYRGAGGALFVIFCHFSIDQSVIDI